MRSLMIPSPLNKWSLYMVYEIQNLISDQLNWFLKKMNEMTTIY